MFPGRHLARPCYASHRHHQFWGMPLLLTGGAGFATGGAGFRALPGPASERAVASAFGGRLGLGGMGGVAGAAGRDDDALPCPAWWLEIWFPGGRN